MDREFAVSPKQIFHIELFILLIAFELLMSFSFLGYIHIEPISVTISYIPVLIAGCLLGPLYSAALGAVFGIASLWKASAFYVLAGDRIFSPFLSGEPVRSLLLSVGTRLCFGAAIGILYWAAKRSARHQLLWIAIVSFFGKQLHSFFVYGAMGILFPEQGHGIGDAFRNFFRPGEIGVALLISLLLMGIWKIWTSPQVQQYRNYVERKKRDPCSHKNRKMIILAVVPFLAFATTIGIYFVDRIRYMMSVYGIHLSDEASHDLTHLQFQFLFGTISLFLIVYIISRIVHDCIVYRVYNSLDKDTLTGLLNRKGFFRICSHLLKDIQFSQGQQCYFLILDIDYFKEINDNYGHPEGDRVLQEIADCLEQRLGDIGITGRLGGDEFLAFTHKPLPKELFESRMRDLMCKIREIEYGANKNVSSSIGAVSVAEPTSAETLYQYADQALYRAKRGGRNQYMITSIKAGQLQK